MRSIFDIQNRRALLSSLWVFVFINMHTRDFHEFARREFVEELIAGVSVTEAQLLLAGIVLEVFILMIVLSHLLRDRVNRAAQMAVAGLAIPVFLIGGWPNDLDDIMFLSLELLAFVIVIVVAWTWKVEKAPTQS